MGTTNSQIEASDSKATDGFTSDPRQDHFLHLINELCEWHDVATIQHDLWSLYMVAIEAVKDEDGQVPGRMVSDWAHLIQQILQVLTGLILQHGDGLCISEEQVAE